LLTYKGGTLFYDAASGFIVVSHQASSTAAQTFKSKHRFEREALSSGVSITAYHTTDNGLLIAKEFMHELAANKGQEIKFSGVSAQFQNDATENGISKVAGCAQGTYHYDLHRSPMAMVCQEGSLADGANACGSLMEPNAKAK
jgi:nitrogen fixation protein FixH